MMYTLRLDHKNFGPSFEILGLVLSPVRFVILLILCLKLSLGMKELDYMGE